MSGESDRFSLTAEQYLGRPTYSSLATGWHLYINDVQHFRLNLASYIHASDIVLLFVFSAKFHVLTYLQVRSFFCRRALARQLTIFFIIARFGQNLSDVRL